MDPSPLILALPFRRCHVFCFLVHTVVVVVVVVVVAHILFGWNSIHLGQIWGF